MWTQSQARDVRLRPKLQKTCSEELAVFCKDVKPGELKCFLQTLQFLLGACSAGVWAGRTLVPFCMLLLARRGHWPCPVAGCSCRRAPPVSLGAHALACRKFLCILQFESQGGNCIGWAAQLQASDLHVRVLCGCRRRPRVPVPAGQHGQGRVWERLQGGGEEEFTPFYSTYILPRRRAGICSQWSPIKCIEAWHPKGSHPLLHARQRIPAVTRGMVPAAV